MRGGGVGGGKGVRLCILSKQCLGPSQHGPLLKEEHAGLCRRMQGMGTTVLQGCIAPQWGPCSFRQPGVSALVPCLPIGAVVSLKIEDLMGDMADKTRLGWWNPGTDRNLEVGKGKRHRCRI